MSEKHPTPWTVVDNPLPDGGPVPELRDANGDQVDHSRDALERAASCVNALAGLSVKEIAETIENLLEYIPSECDENRPDIWCIAHQMKRCQGTALVAKARKIVSALSPAEGVKPETFGEVECQCYGTCGDECDDDLSPRKEIPVATKRKPKPASDPKSVFIRTLAEFFVNDAAGKSIQLQLQMPWAVQWAKMRQATPLFGYPTIEEAVETLTEFLQ